MDGFANIKKKKQDLLIIDFVYFFSIGHHVGHVYLSLTNIFFFLGVVFVIVLFIRLVFFCMKTKYFFYQIKFI